MRRSRATNPQRRWRRPPPQRAPNRRQSPRLPRRQRARYAGRHQDADQPGARRSTPSLSSMPRPPLHARARRQGCSDAGARAAPGDGACRRARPAPVPARVTRPAAAPSKPVAAQLRSPPPPNAASEADVGNKLREIVASKQFDRMIARKPDRDAIVALYQKGRSFQPLWVAQGAPSDRARTRWTICARSTPTASIRRTIRCRSSMSAARKPRPRPR